MPKPITCFVIQPFGEDGHTVERAMRELFSNLINPAVKIAEGRTGRQIICKPETETETPGDIRQHIIDRLINADILVCVLYSSHAGKMNPNVIYELAVAHGAGREAIILRHAEFYDGRTIFDFDKERTITFKEEMLERRNRLLIDRLTEALCAEIEKLDAMRPRVAFGNPNWDALGSRHVQYRLIKNINGLDALDNFSLAEMSRMLNSAQEFIAISDIELRHLAELDVAFFLPNGQTCTYYEILSYNVLRGVDVTLLTMDPKHPALSHLFRKFTAPEAADELQLWRQEIELAEKNFRYLADQIRAADEIPGQRKGKLTVVSVLSGIISARLTMTDEAAVIAPIFFHSKHRGGGPGLWVKNDTTAYQFYRKEFEDLVEANEARPTDAATGAVGRG